MRCYAALVEGVLGEGYAAGVCSRVDDEEGVDPVSSDGDDAVRVPVISLSSHP